MRCGELELNLIHTGLVSVDAGGPFGLVPRALYRRYVEPDADNNVLMALTCLLVRSRGKTILVDTGLGDKLAAPERRRWHLETDGGLSAELARHDVRPEDVDIVLNTHLHSDHCGGNTRLEADRLSAAFPRAEYWVQRIEWADASHPDARTASTYLPENFAPLMAEGRLRLLHGDTPVTDEVRCVVTPGHTRGHQSVVLESRGWRALYVADMATFALHMQRLSWLTAYDVLPLENVATKTRWRRWAMETGAWLIFEHDPKTPIARLIEHGGRVEMEPVGEAEPLTEGFPTPQRLPG
jgi:glyoxylase-like metal-dependent hydrolase (beta-lactamase superfamily II)